MGSLAFMQVWADKDLKKEYLERFDSVEVSLLTCSPHEEIYSLYGHSALRWHDMRTGGNDIVFNWGIFNFDKPYFVLRFVFGLTDYELGVLPYQPFCDYYQKWGSSVTEQVINLTSEEKVRLHDALYENLKPENRIYRYNFFYDNCSTRPRDMIERCLKGSVEYAQRQDYSPSFRQMVGISTRNHPWAKFGNDMLLGVKADMATDRKAQEFLPENLMYDFNYATINNNDDRRPLIIARRMPVMPGVQVIEQDFPLSPTVCALLLLTITIFLTLLEWKIRKRLIAYDILLMLIQGLAGCVLFVMLFSQHPTTSTNLQILLLNPLPLFFIPAVIRKKDKRWWKLQLIMIVLFYLGAIFQRYAEGMLIVASCLLIRTIVHINRKKTQSR